MWSSYRARLVGLIGPHGPRTLSGVLVWLATTGALLLAVGSVAGCAAQQAPLAAAATSSRSAAASTAVRQGAQVSEPRQVSAVLPVALAAMAAFCQPQLTREAWRAGLDPSLTVAAAGTYATVDPARVACRRVVGTGVLGEGDAFTQLVRVPTDAGTYRVLLSRDAASAPWLVWQIAPVAVSR